MHDAVITEQRVVYEPTRWIKKMFSVNFRIFLFFVLEKNFTLQRVAVIAARRLVRGENKH
jgi:hypothetical protein